MKKLLVLLLSVLFLSIATPSYATDEPPYPPAKIIIGTPTCDGDSYPFELPEDDEWYTYYADTANGGDDPFTFRFYTEETKTGKIVNDIEHVFPKPNCDEDTPDVKTDTTEPDRDLPDTGIGLYGYMYLTSFVLFIAGFALIYKSNKLK